MDLTVTNIHELKTRPVQFDAVMRGEKTFEVRRNDDDFRVGVRLAGGIMLALAVLAAAMQRNPDA